MDVEYKFKVTEFEFLWTEFFKFDIIFEFEFNQIYFKNYITPLPNWVKFMIDYIFQFEQNAYFCSSIVVKNLYHQSQRNYNNCII